MPNSVELAAHAERLLRELHPSIRTQFDQAVELIRVRPYQWADTAFITESTMYGRRFFALLSAAKLPYVILYRVFESERTGENGLVVIFRLERITP